MCPEGTPENCADEDRDGYGCCPIKQAVPPKPRPAGQRPCPPGKARGVDTAGQCCWPGQAWNGSACVGTPTCPTQFHPAGNDCVLAACQEGMIRESVHNQCCWPGQAWMVSSNKCIGDFTCSPGLVPNGNDCTKSPTCDTGQQLTSDKLHCCWPGQYWSGPNRACTGLPTECPSHLVARDSACLAPPTCLGGKELTQDRTGCCWPGQQWDRGQCSGVVTCPSHQVFRNGTCQAPPECHNELVLTTDRMGCCWPGQQWRPYATLADIPPLTRDLFRCTGVPSSCPNGRAIDAKGETCIKARHR